jgi:protein translocase SecG subunit
MDIVTALKYTLVVVCSLLIVSILLQNRGGGLGTIFGGSGGGEYYRSRRGIEGLLYNSTIVLAIVFAVISIAIAILNA